MKLKKISKFIFIPLSISCVGICIVFINNKHQVKDDTCTITQYADITGEPANCYTITVGDKLIVIDGGWADNADTLRQIIKENGNHVDAWIISHHHSDHVGAFNVIFADPQGITVDAIYDNGYDYDFLQQTGEPYDRNGLEPLDTFYDSAVTNDLASESVML